MAEHVERTRLQQDLRYRFDYLAKFLQFTKEDIHLLNNLAPLIFPHLSTIVRKVYQKLYSFDVTKEYFLIRNDDFTSCSSSTDETDLTVNSNQTMFRQDMLTVYLKRVFLQTEWNDSFLEFLSHVGRIHGNEKSAISVHVDYIHINCLLSYLEHLFIDFIWTLDQLEHRQKWLSIRAVNHFFWIQNDLFTMHYGISITDRPKSPITSTNNSNDSKQCSKCCF